MPDEVREHLTRDQRPFLHPESLQILQIHSSMTVLLLFSSPHTFSTGFRSEDWDGHSRSLVLCPVTHFCVVFKVCFWNIFRLEDPNMAHYKISNQASHFLIFYLLIFDRISDAMCTLVCSKLWIWMGIYFRYSLLIRISRGTTGILLLFMIFIKIHFTLKLYLRNLLCTLICSHIARHICHDFLLDCYTT